MKHPSQAGLALHAGGDLPLWRGWLVGWHAKRCPDCRRQVELYRHGMTFVGDAATCLPDDVNWGGLSLEMRANIQVGLEADECVTPARPRAPRLGWHVAAAVASVALVILSGFWLLIPSPGGVAGQGFVLSATAEGLELADVDRALTLMHSSSEPVLLSVSVDGAMAEHFVDDETGMVTINNVYVQ